MVSISFFFLALYTKLHQGRCLTHIGREGAKVKRNSVIVYQCNSGHIALQPLHTVHTLQDLRQS